MNRLMGFLLAGLVIVLAAAMPAGASAELEGIRDCLDVKSAGWKQFDGHDKYKDDHWAVFAGKGLKPSCNFARKWAKKGVHKAVAPPKREYRRRIRGRAVPAGWMCWVQSSPDPVISTGGLLQCLLYRKGKLIGSFAAAPDLDLKRPF